MHLDQILKLRPSSFPHFRIIGVTHDYPEVHGLSRQQAIEESKEVTGIERTAAFDGELVFSDIRCCLGPLSIDGIKSGRLSQGVQSKCLIFHAFHGSGLILHEVYLELKQLLQIASCTIFVHDPYDVNKFSLGISFQNDFMVLCQFLGSLMPRCRLTFASNSDLHFSFRHLHDRYVV